MRLALTFFWCALTLGGLTAGCVNSKPPAQLSEGCLLNTDCAAPLVCAFQRCHQQCTEDRDCQKAPYIRCVRSDEGTFKVCLLPEDYGPARCVRNSDCPVDLICMADGVCRVACVTDRDCTSDTLCVNGGCGRSDEVDAGLLLGGPPGDGGLRCLRNSDCTGGLVCLQGSCALECVNDRDCAVGDVCDLTLSRCVRRAGSSDGGGGADGGLACRFNSDCPANLFCRDGQCLPECVTGRDCEASLYDCCLAGRCARGPVCTQGGFDGGTFDAGSSDAGRCLNDLQCDNRVACDGIERCIGGQCARAPKALCDDENPCTVDLCTESGPSCSYQTLAAPDVDGDGHYPRECGGTADDCDDTRNDVYPGALERCDAVDNNCNGAIDENTWSERPNSRGPVWSQQTYFTQPGAPSWVRAGNAIDVVLSGDRQPGTVDGFALSPVDLAWQAGPTPLLRSRTPWNRCQIVDGQRFSRARVAESPTQLLTTTIGLWTTDDGSGCCPPGSSWSSDSWLVRSEPDFQRPDAGVLFSQYLTGCSSTFTLPSFSVASDVTAVFVPPRNHWRLFYWDGHAGPSSTLTLYTTTLSLSGQVGVQRAVLTTPFTSALYSHRSLVVPRVTPQGVLLAWTQPTLPASGVFTDRHLRYALFDFDFTAPLWGPVGDPARFAVFGVAVDGDVATFLVEGAQGLLETLAVSVLDGGVQRATAVGLPNMYVYEGNDLFELDPSRRPALAPINGGYAVAVVRRPAATGAPSVLSFAWQPAADGGTSNRFDLPLPGVPSAVELVPLGPKRLGALWVQGTSDGGPGPLTKTLFECGP